MKTPRLLLASCLCLALPAALGRAADSDPGEAAAAPASAVATKPLAAPPTATPATATHATAPTSTPTPAPASTPTSAQAPAAKLPAGPPLPPRFLQVRDRVDNLFRRRVTTPPALDPRQNPFRPAGAFVPTVVAADGRVTPAPVEQPPPDQVLLQDAVATLKVGGVFEIKGRQHRTVNGRPYKEGDVIPAQAQGQPVYLKIKTLTPKTMTLALRDAETTVAF